MNLISKFWTWYDRNLPLNTSIATVLFFLQLVHLTWLTGNVVVLKLFGIQLFPIGDLWQFAIILVDYTEIPAIITTSLLYISQLRKRFNYKSLIFLFLIDVQLVHLFWITDEFVIEAFNNQSGVNIPPFFAWVAILIDYLELPVIFDTSRQTLKYIKEGKIIKAAQILREKD